jgi:hypothetical protein
MIIFFLAVVILCISFLIYKPSLVIVTAHYNEDIEWLRKTKYPVVLCDKPGAKSSSFTPDKSCTLPVNKGREASSYLKYIVENYDRLPDRIAFIHGHEETVHQKYPKHILKAIDDAKDLDYVSLNNWIHMKKRVCETDTHLGTECGSWTAAFDDMKEHWESLFKPIVKYEMPEYFRFDASAQFVVTRKAIQRHPKEVYQKLLDYMIEDGQNDFVRGVVMEFMWQSIFSDTRNDVCDTMNECSNEEYRKTRFIPNR